MKRFLLTALALMLALPGVFARDFDQDFEHATLRLDYVFWGTTRIRRSISSRP